MLEFACLIAFRGVLPVGVLDAAENRGRLFAALGVQVSHSPHVPSADYQLTLILIALDWSWFSARPVRVRVAHLGRPSFFY
jgi:hypothetical protein